MGIYPTAESLGLQALLLLLALVGAGWILLRSRGSGLGTRNNHQDGVSRAPNPEPRAPNSDNALLRSIERIETDLAEVRVELERMRERVKPEDVKPSSPGRES